MASRAAPSGIGPRGDARDQTGCVVVHGTRRRPLGVGSAPSPDYLEALRGLRSLGAACASPSMAPLAGDAGSQGTADPSLKSRLDNL